jgi:hypothetical protein
MLEMGTSGLMSGDGKRGGAWRQSTRAVLDSTACLGPSTPQGAARSRLSRTALLPPGLADAVGSLDCRFWSLHTQPKYAPVQRFKCCQSR